MCSEPVLAGLGVNVSALDRQPKARNKPEVGQGY